MNRFFRLWAPAAVLGLIIGCAGEEGVDVNPPPAPTTTPVPAPGPETPDIDEAPALTPAESHQAEEALHPEGTEAKPADEPKAEEPLTPAQAEEPKAEEPKAEEPKAEEPKAEEPKAEEPEVEAAPSLEGPGANAATLGDEEIAEIKKLPAEDHEFAIAQAVCPVSGENLGSMDVPLKVNAEGRDFYICCKGCEKKVKSDPKSVLAKLDAAK